jgi:hypothetical protein
MEQRNHTETAPALRTGTTYHVGVDVRGALLNWKAREFGSCCRHDDGRRMTAREARLAFMDELSKGHEIIPCGPCDNWDWQKGCLGHPDTVTEVRP